MILQRNLVKNATSNEAPVLTLSGAPTNGVVLAIENLSAVNFAQYRVQGCNTNVDADFVDIVAGSSGNYSPNFNTSGILAPSGSSLTVVVSSSQFVRVLASSNGGAALNISVFQLSSGSPSVVNNGALA